MKNQITALLFKFDGSLLYAKGTHLIDSSSKTPLKIFDSERIHKIYADGTVIQGQRSIATLKNNSLDLFTMRDWILDILVLEDSLIVLTSHNTITHLTFQYKILNCVQCEENSLSYAGEIYGDCWEDIQVAIGTILDGILLFDTLNLTEAGKAKIKTRLCEHKGVVYQVSFNKEGDKLCSASDDRTAIIWDLIDQQSVPLVGHAGRVWNCGFAGNNVITTSEDGSCKIWDIHGVCINTFHGHGAKNIWSFATSMDNSRLATGGSDSGVIVRSLNLKHTCQDIAFSDCNQVGYDRKEIAKSFQYLGNDRVIILTSTGRFIVHNWKLKIQTLLHQDVGFVRSPILRVSGNVVVISNHCGQLLILSANNRFPPNYLRVDGTKIVGLYIAAGRSQNTEHIFVFHCQNQSAIWITITFNENSVCEQDRRELVLPLDAIVTSIAFIEHEILLIGCRDGSLVVYDLSIDTPTPNILNHSLVYVELHGKDAVTDIKLKVVETCQQWSIMTIGRDGNYSTCTIVCLPTLKVTRTHKSKISQGNLEKILCSNDTVYILGFFDKMVFIYNYTQKLQVFDFDCGGSRRIWDCLISDSGVARFEFAYHRHSRIIQVEYTSENPVIEPGHHALETHCAHFLKFRDVTAQILVTGGEEGILVFYSFNQNRSLNRLTICNDHTGSIKCLDYDIESNTLFSAGSSQELKAFRLEPVFLEQEIVSLLCAQEACAPISNIDVEARIMDISFSNSDLGNLVASTSSDGSINLWKYELQSFTHLSVAMIENCLLKCKIVAIVLLNLPYLILFTGSTSGNLIMWNITKLELIKIAQFKLHQSGIKALCASASGNVITCLTGGDDNAVSRLEIIFKNIDNYSHSYHSITESHVSCVVGCYFENSRYFTISIDQRLNEYRFDNSLKLIKSTMFDISDASCMAINDQDFVIVGLGIGIMGR